MTAFCLFLNNSDYLPSFSYSVILATFGIERDSGTLLAAMLTPIPVPQIRIPLAIFIFSFSIILVFCFRFLSFSPVFSLSAIAGSPQTD